MNRRTYLAALGASTITLAGCTDSTTPSGTDTLSPAPNSTPTASPTPTATGLPDFPFERVDPSECTPVTLPQPAPTSQFQPKEYPTYPKTITRQTAEGFARSFENVYEYNRYLATHSNVRELSYSPTVRQDLTEPIRDGFLIGVDGLRGTFDGEAYSDDPVAGVYFVTPEYALRGDVEQPTLYDVDSLESVEVTDQQTISCGASPSYKRPDDFYIENRDGQTHRIELTVTKKDSWVWRSIDGCYEVPERTGVVFRNVGEYGTEYTVTAEVVGGNSVSTDWGVGCAEEMFTPEVGTHGGVVVESGSLYFTQNGCDVQKLGTELDEYVSPAEIESCGSSEAQERALTAEEAHITEQLENASCVEDWGLTDYVGWGKEATVINQSADGVYVNVSHPFWYSTSEEEADVGTKATYRISGDEAQRVSGTTVSPC